MEYDDLQLQEVAHCINKFQQSEIQKCFSLKIMGLLLNDLYLGAVCFYAILYLSHAFFLNFALNNKNVVTNPFSKLEPVHEQLRGGMQKISY